MAQKNRNRLLKRLRNDSLLYIMFIPVLAWYLIFCYVPMTGIVLAFKNFKFDGGIWGSPWVGIRNFRKMLRDRDFLQAVRNTLIIGIGGIVFQMPCAIALAILINEVKGKWNKKIYQTIVTFPHFISWVTLSGLFIQLLSPSSGPIAAITTAFGGTPYYFMGRVETFRWVLVVTNIWKSVGWGSIIYLAALSGVDQEMYEAALIDGATRFQRVWYITLPSIFPTITIMLILQSGSILNDNFDQVYNMMNDAVYRVANVLGVYTYDLGLKNLSNAGLAKSTAVGLFKNVIALILVLTTNAISKKISDNGIW